MLLRLRLAATAASDLHSCSVCGGGCRLVRATFRDEKGAIVRFTEIDMAKIDSQH